MSTKLFAGGHLAADAAECFAGNAKIRSNHVLRYTLDAVGIAIQKPGIFLFGTLSK